MDLPILNLERYVMNVRNYSNRVTYWNNSQFLTVDIGWNFLPGKLGSYTKSLMFFNEDFSKKMRVTQPPAISIVHDIVFEENNFLKTIFVLLEKHLKDSIFKDEYTISNYKDIRFTIPLRDRSIESLIDNLDIVIKDFYEDLIDLIISIYNEEYPIHSYIVKIIDEISKETTMKLSIDIFADSVKTSFFYKEELFSKDYSFLKKINYSEWENKYHEIRTSYDIERLNKVDMIFIRVIKDLFNRLVKDSYFDLNIGNLKPKEYEVPMNISNIPIIFGNGSITEKKTRELSKKVLENKSSYSKELGLKYLRFLSELEEI